LDILDREITRQNRIALFVLITGSILLLLSIMFGAPLYYYRYTRSDTKASISKNPNYGLFEIVFINSISIVYLELYTPDQWEIDKDSVTLDKLVGHGHFGQVYQGVLKLSDGTFKSCAVKVMNCKDFLCLLF
jgi:hypothetical protein